MEYSNKLVYSPDSEDDIEENKEIKKTDDATGGGSVESKHKPWLVGYIKPEERKKVKINKYSKVEANAWFQNVMKAQEVDAQFFCHPRVILDSDDGQLLQELCYVLSECNIELFERLIRNADEFIQDVNYNKFTTFRSLLREVESIENNGGITIINEKGKNLRKLPGGIFLSLVIERYIPKKSLGYRSIWSIQTTKHSKYKQELRKTAAIKTLKEGAAKGSTKGDLGVRVMKRGGSSLKSKHNSNRLKKLESKSTRFGKRMTGPNRIGNKSIIGSRVIRRVAETAMSHPYEEPMGKEVQDLEEGEIIE